MLGAGRARAQGTQRRRQYTSGSLPTGRQETERFGLLELRRGAAAIGLVAGEGELLHRGAFLDKRVRIGVAD